MKASVGVAIILVCLVTNTWIASTAEKVGYEVGRRDQAALTPAACREQQKIAADALENSERMARGWLACDIERASLQQCCDVSKKAIR